MSSAVFPYEEFLRPFYGTLPIDSATPAPQTSIKECFEDPSKCKSIIGDWKCILLGPILCDPGECFTKLKCPPPSEELGSAPKQTCGWNSLDFFCKAEVVVTVVVIAVGAGVVMYFFGSSFTSLGVVGRVLAMTISTVGETLKMVFGGVWDVVKWALSNVDYLAYYTETNAMLWKANILTLFAWGLLTVAQELEGVVDEFWVGSVFQTIYHFLDYPLRYVKSGATNISRVLGALVGVVEAPFEALLVLVSVLAGGVWELIELIMTRIDKGDFALQDAVSDMTALSKFDVLPDSVGALDHVCNKPCE